MSDRKKLHDDFDSLPDADINTAFDALPDDAPDVDSGLSLSDLASGKRSAAPKYADPGAFSTVVHQGLSGFTKGWSDELQGRLSQAADSRLDVDGAALRLPDGTTRLIKSDEDKYAAPRDLERQKLAASMEHRPWLSTAAQMAGDLGSDAVLAGMGLPAFSAPAQILTGALSGAGNADDETPGGALGGAGIGAGLSAAGMGLGKYAVGPFLSKAGQKISPKLIAYLKKYGGERALRAVGYIQKDMASLPEGRAQKIGQDLLEEGVVKAGRTAGDLRPRLEKMKSKTGELIGKYLDDADAAAKAAGSGFDLRRVIERLEKEVLPAFDAPGLGTQRAQLKRLIKEYADKAAEGVGFADANRFKSVLQETISQWKDVPASQKVKAEVQRVLKEEVDGQLHKTLGTEAGEGFSKAKGKFGSAADALDANASAVDRALGNRSLSLTDYLTGGMGVAGSAATGNITPAIVGLAAAGANKVARERLSSVLAAGSYKAAQSLERGWLSKLPALVKGEALGPFAAKLASAKGEDALQALDEKLEAESEDYRAIKERLMSRMAAVLPDEDTN